LKVNGLAVMSIINDLSFSNGSWQGYAKLDPATMTWENDIDKTSRKGLAIIGIWNNTSQSGYFGVDLSKLPSIISHDPEYYFSVSGWRLFDLNYQEIAIITVQGKAGDFGSIPYKDSPMGIIGRWERGENGKFNFISSYKPVQEGSVTVEGLDNYVYMLNNNYDLSIIVNSILGSSSGQTILSVEPVNQSLSITASTWSGTININYVIKATDAGGKIEAKQINFGSGEVAGSVISGGNGNDDIKGFAGWDIIDGGAGDDLIHGGNGRDIISGGAGGDELHGDFGWNTYKSEKEGVSDLIAIKSDHYLVNWLYGKAGNSPNGEKADIIEGLDAIDKIKIIGIDTSEITFAANVIAKGVTGIGIYGKGILEALYTGGDLSINQITQMTSGDASAAAMSNSVNSYGVW